MTQENPTSEELNKEQKEKTAYTEEDFYKEIKDKIKKERGENGENFELTTDDIFTLGVEANFRNKLPGGYRRNMISKLEKERPDIIKRSDDENREKYGGAPILQIFSDMDKVIEKLGFKIEDVKKWSYLIEKSDPQNPDFRWKEYDPTHLKDIIKIYCAMRNLGYKDYPDLSQ